MNELRLRGHELKGALHSDRATQHHSLFLLQGPNHIPLISHRSSQTPVGSDRFSAGSCFSRPWELWGALAWRFACASAGAGVMLPPGAHHHPHTTTSHVLRTRCVRGAVTPDHLTDVVLINRSAEKLLSFLPFQAAHFGKMSRWRACVLGMRSYVSWG